MSKRIPSTSLAALLIFFSSCGKGVITNTNSTNASNGGPNSGPPSTTTPPGGPGGGTITPTPAPTSGEGCPANQIAFFDFAQSNPAQETFDLNISGSSLIISVMVNGQDVAYTFDANAGSITLGDAGQPGEQIQIEACLPSPIGKPTGKPTGKPEPTPSCPSKPSSRSG